MRHRLLTSLGLTIATSFQIVCQGSTLSVDAFINKVKGADCNLSFASEPKELAALPKLDWSEDGYYVLPGQKPPTGHETRAAGYLAAFLRHLGRDLVLTPSFGDRDTPAFDAVVMFGYSPILNLQIKTINGSIDAYPWRRKVSRSTILARGFFSPDDGCNTYFSSKRKIRPIYSAEFLPRSGKIFDESGTFSEWVLGAIGTQRSYLI